jgi:transcription antitermination protein NusB
MGQRHRGREAALRLLYQIELTGDASPDALRAYWEDLPPKLSTSRSFAEELVRSARDNAARIDELIDSAVSNWQLGRIARVDLSILRLAVGEMLAFPDTAVEIVIDEAVELARSYSDAEGPAFVNGVLDRVVHEGALSRESR